MTTLIRNFDLTVPFDPGFSEFSFDFTRAIKSSTESYNKIKATHQKKYWLATLEPAVVDYINAGSAFYLGCILWGGFIHFRFKDSPKKISGNDTENLCENDLKNLDCASQAKAMLEYIKVLNKDCKYFLRRESKVSGQAVENLEGYVEFAQINNNFIGIKNTSDIKIPKCIKHFEDLSNEQLDKLCEKIYSAIDEGTIGNLLKVGFY